MAPSRDIPFAYTYRDYVVRAFNEDVSYDQFVLTAVGGGWACPWMRRSRWQLAAMGFLTVGRRFNVNVPDVIDDRIDVITRGLMGLTVTCARCHDHKYDPIPTADYYSLYGVLASSVEPPAGELPLLSNPSIHKRTNTRNTWSAYRKLSKNTRIVSVRSARYDRPRNARLRGRLSGLFGARSGTASGHVIKTPLKTDRTILRGPIRLWIWGHQPMAQVYPAHVKTTILCSVCGSD